MDYFLARRLCRDSAQGRFLEGLSDFVDAGQYVGAVAGPFVGPVRQMADRIPNVLNSAFLSPLVQQFRKLLKRRTARCLRHPASKNRSSSEANQDGHHDKDSGTPVSHPADIA